ncbi:hypothetical protein BCV72DRAFT_305838 [Rhizopus microsporus var. microsporus]|uniref:Uncharacterized protein n=1 Tax=Rhizopus microsporus var. microsporus TaxID=86635 RepID=A0A1X0R287_RHIZD|nr:hypothetical protein BCV72DRAFT_305838 [Rhizopus microsporus var. microsporus]
MVRRVGLLKAHNTATELRHISRYATLKEFWLDYGTNAMLKEGSHSNRAASNIKFHEPVRGKVIFTSPKCKDVKLETFMKVSRPREFRRPNNSMYRSKMFGTTTAMGQRPDGRIKLQGYCTQSSIRLWPPFENTASALAQKALKTLQLKHFLSAPPDEGHAST